MENINWICKAKTVGNNIVWKCHPRITENFEATAVNPDALIGSTKLPQVVDITLPPPTFSINQKKCGNTKGFIKLGDWAWQTDNNKNPSEKKGMGWMFGRNTNPSTLIDAKDMGRENGYYAFCTRMDRQMRFSIIDLNNTNNYTIVKEIQLYQEFSQFFSILLRDKNTPGNYILIPRTRFWTDDKWNNFFEFLDMSDPQPRQMEFYNYTNFKPEPMCQSAGTWGKDGTVYELFVKPYKRATYNLIPQPQVIPTFNKLPDSLLSKLHLWFDGSDPMGDGTVLKDDTPLKNWKDKSSNKVTMTAYPFFPVENRNSNGEPPKSYDQFQDGDYVQYHNFLNTKKRFPRSKAGILNGRSVVRFNSASGFAINLMASDSYAKGPNYPTPKNPIKSYTIFAVVNAAEYIDTDAIFGNRKISLRLAQQTGCPAFWMRVNGDNAPSSSTFANISMLNKWVIVSVKMVENTPPDLYVNGIMSKNYLDWERSVNAVNQPDMGVVDDGFDWNIGANRYSSNSFDWQQQGFAGDIAEIMFFATPLSDNDRNQVEGYLAQKWNLVRNLPDSNPFVADPNSSVQLFTAPNYGAMGDKKITTWGAGVLCAVQSMPQGQTVAFSADGVNNWQWVNIPFMRSAVKPFRIASDGEIFVASDGMAIGFSSDGLNWTNTTINASNFRQDGLFVESIVYGGPVAGWVAYCGGGNGYLFSNDGKTWTSPNPKIEANGFNYRYYFLDTFIAPWGNRLWTSKDCKNWDWVDVPDSHSQLTGCCCWTGTRYLIGGNAGPLLFSSTDLKTWSAVPGILPFATTVHSNWGGGVNALCSNGNVTVLGFQRRSRNHNFVILLYSTDGGLTFTDSGTNVGRFQSSAVTSLTYNGTHFIACVVQHIDMRGPGDWKYISSKDGIKWDIIPTASVTMGTSVGNQMWGMGSTWSDFMCSKTNNVGVWGPKILGRSSLFPAGSYGFDKLKNIGINSLVSFKIPKGLELVLYKSINMTGPAKVFNSDVPDLSIYPGWNKTTGSIVIRPMMNIGKDTDLSKLQLVEANPNSIYGKVQTSIRRIDGNDMLLLDNNNPNNLYWHKTSDFMLGSSTADGSAEKPLSIDGLIIWFDGKQPFNNGSRPQTGQKLNEWKDRSGNDNHTTGINGNITYDENKGAVFNGSSYFNLPDGTLPIGDTPYTFYIVCNYTSTGGQFGLIGAGDPGQGQGSFLTIHLEAGTFMTAWNGMNVNGGCNLKENTTYVHFNAYETRGERRMGLNGTICKTDKPNVPRRSGTSMNVLGKGTNVGNMMGSIAEVLLYDTNHTDTQREFIEAYLMEKWGIKK